MKKTERMVYIAILVAVSLVFGYIEHLLPFDFGIPGVKLGLANAVVMCALYLIDAKTALAVQIIRIVLSGLLFSSLSTMLYSFAGGMVSYFGMLLLRKVSKLSVTGVSISGGVLHNLGQLAVATAVTQTPMLAYYFPVLLASGTLTGLAIGLVSALLIKKMPEKIIKLKEK